MLKTFEQQLFWYSFISVTKQRFFFGFFAILFLQIRFICCMFHPSRDMIRSVLCPRFELVRWLLRRCDVSVQRIN
jgi:hypothetical protein